MAARDRSEAKKILRGHVPEVRSRRSEVGSEVAADKDGGRASRQEGWRAAFCLLAPTSGDPFAQEGGGCCIRLQKVSIVRTLAPLKRTQLFLIGIGVCASQFLYIPFQ